MALSPKKLVHPARVELTTSSFGGKRSIQLSYGCPKDEICGEVLPGSILV